MEKVWSFQSIKAADFRIRYALSVLHCSFLAYVFTRKCMLPSNNKLLRL